MIDWSVVCPACGGPGRIVRDVFGDASIVCDAYGGCAPNLDAEIAEAERHAADLAHELDFAEDVEERANLRADAAAAGRLAAEMLVLRETRLAEARAQLDAWRAAVSSW